MDQLAVVKQAANERTFAIVNAAASNKPQQVFMFVGVQISLDVAFNQRGGMGH